MNISALRWAVLLACASSSGCAYLTTFTDSIPIADKAMALDMKTRVVFQRSDVVCAEPSPDALASISASGSLSALTGGAAGVGDRSVNSAFGLAESAAFTGLRTPSIQLLRDAMYRLCEGAASGMIDKKQFHSLQRRYQTTMLALLAVEQLTRPVVAGQALLTGQASAAAGAGAGDAAVAKAQETLKATKDQRLTLEAEVEAEQQKLATLEADLRAKEKDKALASEVPSKKAEFEAQRTVVRDKQRRLQEARADEAEARLALLAAQSRAGASAGTQGSLGGVAVGYAQATSAVAKAVEEIVDEAYDTFADEACIDFVKFNIDPYERVSTSTAGQTVAQPLESRYSVMLKEEKTIDRSARPPALPASAAFTGTEVAAKMMNACVTRFERPKREAPKPATEQITAMADELAKVKRALDGLYVRGQPPANETAAPPAPPASAPKAR